MGIEDQEKFLSQIEDKQLEELKNLEEEAKDSFLQGEKHFRRGVYKVYKIYKSIVESKEEAFKPYQEKFHLYIQQRIGKQGKTSYRLSNVVKLLYKHDKADLLLKSPDDAGYNSNIITLLDFIYSIKSEEQQKSLLENFGNLTIKELKEDIKELILPSNKKTSKKINHEGLKSLFFKYDRKASRIAFTAKRKDPKAKEALQKLNEFLKNLSSEEIELILEKRKEN